MTRTASVLLVLFAAVGSAAPVPKPKPVPDSDAILGTWTIVELNVDNAPLPGAKFPEMVATIDKEKLRVTTGDSSAVDTTAYKLDATKKQIDLLPKEAGDPLKKGVYTLDGDTLLIAIGIEPDGARPKEAKTAIGIMYFKFQRIKEEKK